MNDSLLRTWTPVLPRRQSFPVAASSTMFSPSSSSFLPGCVCALLMTRLHRVRMGRCGRDWRRSLDGVVMASRFCLWGEWQTSQVRHRKAQEEETPWKEVAYFAQPDEDPHRDAHQRQAYQYEGQRACECQIAASEVKLAAVKHNNLDEDLEAETRQVEIDWVDRNQKQEAKSVNRKCVDVSYFIYLIVVLLWIFGWILCHWFCLGFFFHWSLMSIFF